MLYQTHAIVHLQNIRENLLNIREKVGPNRKILIAVKANGYGHGAVRVSQMAEKIGIEWLGVATVPEAIQLRQAGLKMPILKFSPVFPEEVKAAIECDLTLAVCDIKWIRALNEVAASAGKKVKVHLKADTGMGRIGASKEDSPMIAQEIFKSLKNLELEGLFTHLPVSDESSKAFTQRQIAEFVKLSKHIEADLDYKIPLVHCANSGAVLAHPEGWLDMVRPGIMIYGFYPSPQTPQTIPLKPGMSFKTRVSFLKRVTKGTSIGYGRTWVASEDTWIATFPAGYADGFNRLFSNKGRVLINGCSYPIAGRVCMDQSMTNLGPGTDVKVGDEVVLIGSSGKEEISVNEWAQKLDTITYEVTCQINSRVQRYFEE